MAFTRYGKIRNELFRQGFPTVYAPVVLRDADSNYIPIPISERLLQCIWYDQRIQRESLTTTAGQRVRVIFQGWWNLEAGPDFRHATIQIGDGPEQTGAIEVHLRADDWFHHGHQHDPLYNDVVLHVVLWQAGSNVPAKTHHGQQIPQVVLQDQLAASLDALHDEIDLDAYPHNVGNHSGRCAPLLKTMPEQVIGELFSDAGDERFYAKVRRFVRWIHRAGPEQAFYEGWMEALGYKGNKSPFRLLAQRLPVTELRDHRAQIAPLMFGVANFLPTAAARAADTPSQSYIKRLWSAWWKLRPDYETLILPADSWRLHGVRPANHPHRRLAAAVVLLKKHPRLFEKTIGAVESGGNPGRFFERIHDEYWSHHFTLGGRTQKKAAELIGAARAGEIVANIVLPFTAAYAKDRGDQKLYHQAKARFDALPAAASNNLMRLAGQQLFDSARFASRFVKTARQQQGLLQVFQDYCLNDKSACSHCHFPDLVRQWDGQ